MKNRTKKAWTFLLIVFVVCAVDLATVPLRGIHFTLSGIIGFITLFAFEGVLLRYCKILKPATIFWASLIGFCLINLPSHIVLWPSTLGSLPDFSIRLMGVVLGCSFFATGRKWLRIAVVVAGCLILAGTNWAVVNTIHYLAHGSFDGRIKEQVELNELLVKNREAPLAFDPTRTYVFYFWYSGCGWCHKRFPEFQRLYNIYRSDSTICFFTLNPVDVPDSGAVLVPDCEIENLFVERSLCDKLSVDGFPTLIIVKGNKVIFRGTVDKACSILQKRE